MKLKGQAFFYGLLGLLLAVLFFGAIAPLVQNMIDSIAPSMTVTTQAFLGIILPGVLIAIVLGFFKTVSPSGS